MPGNGRSEIGLPGRAMNERGRNGIPQQWTKHDSGIECRGRDKERYRPIRPGNGRKKSEWNAGEGTKKGGMIFRNNGQSMIAA